MPGVGANAKCVRCCCHSGGKLALTSSALPIGYHCNATKTAVPGIERWTATNLLGTRETARRGVRRHKGCLTTEVHTTTKRVSKEHSDKVLILAATQHRVRRRSTGGGTRVINAWGHHTDGVIMTIPSAPMLGSTISAIIAFRTTTLSRHAPGFRQSRMSPTLQK